MSRLQRCVYSCTWIISAAMGCARVDPREDYARASSLVEHALGAPASVSPSAGASEAQIAELLADGLTESEAVGLALLNNPRVRASWTRTGMAHANVAQAGLLSNPALSVMLRFPDGGGLANLEAGLAQNIADLWMIPARKKAAQRELDRTILETAREIVSLGHSTRQAYRIAIGAERNSALATGSVQLAAELLRIAEARLEAGATSAIDLHLAQGQLLRAQVEQQRARLAASTARRDLTHLLGLDRLADDVTLVDGLPSPPAIDPNIEMLVKLACDSRLDVRSAREAVAKAAAQLELERLRGLQDVELGVGVERDARRAPPGRRVLADTVRESAAAGALTPTFEPRSVRRAEQNEEIEVIIGPSLEMPLPIFDQNLVQIEKAKLNLEESQATLDAVTQAARLETRQSFDRFATACEIARLYENELAPQARKLLEVSEAAYQAGQTPVLNLIESQRGLLEIQQAHVAALQAAALAQIELESAVGRPVSAFGAGLATNP